MSKEPSKSPQEGLDRLREDENNPWVNHQAGLMREMDPADAQELLFRMLLNLRMAVETLAAAMGGHFSREDDEGGPPGGGLH